MIEWARIGDRYSQSFAPFAPVGPARAAVVPGLWSWGLPARLAPLSAGRGWSVLAGIAGRSVGGRCRTRTCDLSRVKAFQTNFASWRFPTNQPLTRRFSDHPRPPASTFFRCRVSDLCPLRPCEVSPRGSSETAMVPGHEPPANRVGRLLRPTPGWTAPPTLSGGRGLVPIQRGG